LLECDKALALRTLLAGLLMFVPSFREEAKCRPELRQASQ
jgi:hypothetical protein